MILDLADRRSWSLPSSGQFRPTTHLLLAFPPFPVGHSWQAGTSPVEEPPSFIHLTNLKALILKSLMICSFTAEKRSLVTVRWNLGYAVVPNAMFTNLATVWKLSEGAVSQCPLCSEAGGHWGCSLSSPPYGPECEAKYGWRPPLVRVEGEEVLVVKQNVFLLRSKTRSQCTRVDSDKGIKVI